MENSGEHKRHREEEGEDVLESPEVKRLRDNLLFDILDEDAGEQDLASVMRSLEEEIALPSPSRPSPPPPPTAAEQQELLPEEPRSVLGQGQQQQPDLGFLFEASDDELGLPPTDAPSSADEAGTAPEPAEVAGFGQIWGIDDGIDGYEGFGLGMRPQEGASAGGLPEAEDGLVFDGGLFDHADDISGSYDLSDLSWRPESLPAV